MDHSHSDMPTATTAAAATDEEKPALIVVDNNDDDTTATTTTTTNELNQILKLQDTVRTEYLGIVNNYSNENSASQALPLLHNLVAQFMDLNLKAMVLLAAALPAPPYNDADHNHQTIDIIVADDHDDNTAATAVETIEVITRSLSSSSSSTVLKKEDDALVTKP